MSSMQKTGTQFNVSQQTEGKVLMASAISTPSRLCSHNHKKILSMKTHAQNPCCSLKITKNILSADACYLPPDPSQEGPLFSVTCSSAKTSLVFFHFTSRHISCDCLDLLNGEYYVWGERLWLICLLIWFHLVTLDLLQVPWTDLLQSWFVHPSISATRFLLWYGHSPTIFLYINIQQSMSYWIILENVEKINLKLIYGDQFYNWGHSDVILVGQMVNNIARCFVSPWVHF